MMAKFRKGMRFEREGLFGQEIYNIVSKVTDTEVTVIEKWISEDTGKECSSKRVLEKKVDTEGNEYIVVWEYHGEHGVVYGETVRDYREVKEEVKKALEKVRERDTNWKWKAQVTKGGIKLYWEYLEFMGATRPYFTINNAPNDKDMISLYSELGIFLRGAFIGSKSWCDGDFGQCVYSLILKAQRIANDRY